MDFRLTEEQELLRRSVREFAETEIGPYVMEWDQAQHFPSELIPKLAALGLMGIQPYFTTGVGLYRETLGAHQDTSGGFNTGGGAKITLIGPVRLRVDYRVFKLGSGALYSPAHRVYAGINLKF